MYVVEPPSLTAPVTSNNQYCQLCYLQVTSTNTDLKHTQITVHILYTLVYIAFLRFSVDSPPHINASAYELKYEESAHSVSQLQST